MPKRILIFVPVPHAEPPIGGLYSMSSDMAGALGDLGHEVELGFFGRSNSLRVQRRRLKCEGFATTSFDSLRAHFILFHGWLWGDDFRRYVRGFDAVVAVCGSPYVVRPFLASGVPVHAWTAVTMSEDLKGRYERFDWKRRLAYRVALPSLHYLERQATRECAHLWALSRPTLRDMHAIAGNDGCPTSVLLPPVDTTLFCPPSERQARGRLLLFVGRYNDGRKDTDMLLRAFARIRDELDDAKLVLAGEPRPAASLVALARELGVTEHVNFVPEVPREEVAQYLQRADLFVLPSRQEGLCIAALEGMACGLPVVSTRCGGPESYITHGDNGLLVPVGNPAAFADAALQLLSNPQRLAEQGARARLFVTSHCQRDAFAAQIASELRFAGEGLKR